MCSTQRHCRQQGASAVTTSGRIAPGAKADLLFWEGASLFMTPMRDPVRNIVYSAQAEDSNATMIDGKFVMKDRVVTGLRRRCAAG